MKYSRCLKYFFKQSLACPYEKLTFFLLYAVAQIKFKTSFKVNSLVENQVVHVYDVKIRWLEI